MCVCVCVCVNARGGYPPTSQTHQKTEKKEEIKNRQKNTHSALRPRPFSHISGVGEGRWGLGEGSWKQNENHQVRQRGAAR